ncbi:cupin domain-containing protein [uncultured Aeromicrobium sp.]|uniref:cupin domain-containing protein n=1 Tax=uncultured Aeromicrobium sp. TaxID=337820 RepID=UPI0025CF4DD2|nr:cupin domain-containing protein [uncultured Aeromicrobium sp.]
MSQHVDRARIVGREEWGPELDVVTGEGFCREVIGPRLGATLRSLYIVQLAAGSSTIAMRHPMEAVYYVISGKASVESEAADQRLTVEEGSMIHASAGTDYRIVASSDVRLIGGPSPVDPGFGTPAADVRVPEGDPEPELRGFHRDEPGLMVPFISADARLVVWYGARAVSANMNYVVLEPGERNTEHVHRYSEDTIYILEGRGTAEDVTNGVELAFGPGDVVHIPAGIIHAVAADRGERVVSVGGPCPADLDMLRAVGVDVDALGKELGLS